MLTSAVSLLNRTRIFRLPALAYPKGLGCDFAGRVLGRGTEVKDLPIGAEVMGVTLSPVRPRFPSPEHESTVRESY